MPYEDEATGQADASMSQRMPKIANEALEVKEQVLSDVPQKELCLPMPWSQASSTRTY